ncbi:hypothetical protein BGX31_009618 [Mortierella sp. GBA43]|nr:hypothetical protein BGX31_009618 [Mortierella sp. GBA43]
MSGYWHSLSSPKLQDLQQDDHYQHEQPSGGVDKNRKPSSGSKSSMNLQVDTTRSRGRGRGSCSSGTNISVPSSASSLETSSSATLLIQGKVKHDNSHCNSCSCSSSSSNNSINSNNSANSQRPTVQTSRLPSPPLSSTPSYSSSSSSLCPRSPSLHPARYDSEAQTTPFRTEVACLGTDGSNSATRPVESKVMPPRAQVASRAKFFVAEDSESEDEEMEENDGVHECYGNDFAHVDCDPWTQYQSHLITTCRETEQEDHVHDGDDEDSNTVDMDGDYDHGYEHDKDMEEDGFGRMPRPLGTQPRLSPSPSSTCESSDTVTAAAATTTLTRPFPTMQRRHSLLSDLLMAEKRQQQQQLQLLKERQEHDQDYHHTDSGYSPTNSDGEMTAVANISGRVPQHQYQYDRRETCHNMHTTCKKTSPLTRTKKVFKNLSELANISMTTSSLNDSCSGPCGSDDGSTRDLLDEAVPFAFGSLSSSPSSPYILSAYTSTSTLTSTPISPLHSAKTTTTTATMATAGLAAPVPGWTRSHVQVQIQSLVAQSTLTAQRALLNATTTLTDVLFHASQ